MPELVPLGLQVLVISFGYIRLQRHPPRDLETRTPRGHSASWDCSSSCGSSSDPDRQDLRTDAVVPQVRRETQMLVGFDRVETPILQFVGPEAC